LKKEGLLVINPSNGDGWILKLEKDDDDAQKKISISKAEFSPGACSPYRFSETQYNKRCGGWCV
jgi:hypothetical protein